MFWHPPAGTSHFIKTGAWQGIICSQKLQETCREYKWILKEGEKVKEFWFKRGYLLTALTQNHCYALSRLQSLRKAWIADNRRDLKDHPVSNPAVCKVKAQFSVKLFFFFWKSISIENENAWVKIDAENRRKWIQEKRNTVNFYHLWEKPHSK